jgi:hypothetical protein
MAAAAVELIAFLRETCIFCELGSAAGDLAIADGEYSANHRIYSYTRKSRRFEMNI